MDYAYPGSIPSFPEGSLNIPHQERSPNPRILAGTGPLGSTQFGPWTNYEAVGHPERSGGSYWGKARARLLAFCRITLK